VLANDAAERVEMRSIREQISVPAPTPSAGTYAVVIQANGFLGPSTAILPPTFTGVRAASFRSDCDRGR
jgi:hypothetical protein